MGGYDKLGYNNSDNLGSLCGRQVRVLDGVDVYDSEGCWVGELKKGNVFTFGDPGPDLYGRDGDRLGTIRITTFRGQHGLILSVIAQDPRWFVKFEVP